MSPDDNNGWAEYRLMVIDWHDQDIVERRAIKDRLDVISQQLTEIGVERKLGKWAIGGGVAGFVSLAGTVGLKLLGL